MSEDDPVTAAIVVGVVTGGQMVQSNQQAQVQKGQVNQARRRQERMVKEAESQQLEEERLTEVTRQRSAARADQLRRRAESNTYGTTMLTGPLGSPGESQPAGRRTLLGY